MITTTTTTTPTLEPIPTVDIPINESDLIKGAILNQAEKITLATKASLQNVQKIALSEAWKLLQITTASIVQIIETVAADLEGKTKKAIAIEYLNNFYNDVFKIIDIPFVPNIVEPIIHRYVKQLLMIMVSASIDATVTIFRQTGIFLRKENNL